jgi:hypothetical protein
MLVENSRIETLPSFTAQQTEASSRKLGDVFPVSDSLKNVLSYSLTLL